MLAIIHRAGHPAIQTRLTQIEEYQPNDPLMYFAGAGLDLGRALEMLWSTRELFAIEIPEKQMRFSGCVTKFCTTPDWQDISLEFFIDQTKTLS